MVSYNVYRSTSSGAYVEGVCLASDEKPVVGIANGSILYAVDASNGETTRYMYDKEAKSWIEAECPCHGGGSGGSGGGVEPLVANPTIDPDIGITGIDVSFADIRGAVEQGRNVLLFVANLTENIWAPLTEFRSEVQPGGSFAYSADFGSMGNYIATDPDTNLQADLS